MSADLPSLAANLAGAETGELEQALARARAGYAQIGFFPDRRRADCRAYYAVVDELAARTRPTAPASPASYSSTPDGAREEAS
jgi:hypothetical protein